jgi:hypothetical protein
MRRGFKPKLILTPKGEIFAIATGSDACAEHECGSQPMQESLCKGAVFTDNRKILEALRNGESVLYPQLIERKAINRNLEHIHFLEGSENGVVCAAIVAQERYFNADMPLKAYRELDVYRDTEFSGAWDDSSFGFKVVGPKLVSKLKVFFDALQQGDGIFAGSFLKSDEFEDAGGVIVALSSKLRPEHHQCIKDAQSEFEQGLRLKAKSRVQELKDMCNASKAAHVSMPGYVWPQWLDGVDGEVVYAVNPGYYEQKHIAYIGPYTFDSLKEWILAETKYKLQPVVRNRAKASA